MGPPSILTEPLLQEAVPRHGVSGEAAIVFLLFLVGLGFAIFVSSVQDSRCGGSEPLAIEEHASAMLATLMSSAKQVARVEVPRRVPQQAVLKFMDSLYPRFLGSARWDEARAALLAGRHSWQYAAARNRFFKAPQDEPSIHMHLQRREGREALGEADFRVLLGQADPANATGLLDVCSAWPTPIECYVRLDSCGRLFPRCGRPGRLNPYWLLSAASVLPVLALNPRPGDRVLDLCAAPGGKSFLLLQHTDQIHLHSNDGKRCAMLAQAMKCHVPADLDVNITQHDGRWLPASEAFDRVLVDAPCTTDKHLILSTNASAQDELSKLRGDHYPSLQYELLLSGLKALKPGGYLVYCTCTLDSRQNSEVVRSAIRELHNRGEGTCRTVPIYEKLHASFGEYFEMQRDANDTGLLVVPTLKKNWGPLFVSLLAKH